MVNFSETVLFEKKKLNVKQGVLLVGLPGIGLISKLSVDYLIKELKAEKVCTVYSPHFPNQMIAKPNGRLKPITMGLYHKKMKNNDFLFLSSNIQPITVEGQYEVSGKILDFCKNTGIKDVIGIAGYAINKKIEGKPTIYVSGSDQQLVASFVDKKQAKRTEFPVPVVGMAALLPGLSKPFGLKGVCLLVETPGNNIDAIASKHLLTMLEKRFNVNFGDKNTSVRASKIESAIKAAQPEQKAPILPVQETSSQESDQLRYIR
ncbi:PAC2 family protein [uncultured archaeon]|nr:PAC2 family protein [uncultured archaeon]